MTRGDVLRYNLAYALIRGCELGTERTTSF